MRLFELNITRIKIDGKSKWINLQLPVDIKKWREVLGGIAERLFLFSLYLLLVNITQNPSFPRS